MGIIKNIGIVGGLVAALASGCEKQAPTTQGQIQAGKITPEQVIMAEEDNYIQVGISRYEISALYRNQKWEVVYLEADRVNCNNIDYVYVTKICVGDFIERVDIFWGSPDSNSVYPLYCIRNDRIHPNTATQAVFDMANQQMRNVTSEQRAKWCSSVQTAYRECKNKCEYCTPAEEEFHCYEKCDILLLNEQ